MFFTEAVSDHSDGITLDIVNEGLLDQLKANKNILPKGTFSGELSNCVVVDVRHLLTDEVKKSIPKAWQMAKKEALKAVEDDYERVYPDHGTSLSDVKKLATKLVDTIRIYEDADTGDIDVNFIINGTHKLQGHQNFFKDWSLSVDVVLSVPRNYAPTEAFYSWSSK